MNLRWINKKISPKKRLIKKLTHLYLITKTRKGKEYEYKR